MQQLHAEAEKETRYDLETVKRAAALAVKLQESQRNTLTQADVDAMAAEAGIDPVCMRQALSALRQEQTQATGTQRRVPSRWAGTVVAFAIGAVLVMVLIVLGVYKMPAVAPATATLSPPITATEETAVPANGLPLKNGALIAPASVENGADLTAGSTAVPGWKVLSGPARYLRFPGATGGAIALGPNAWLEQLIPTVPGASYRLHYEIAGEAGPEARLHRLTVKAVHPDHSETSQDVSVFTQGGGTLPTGWSQRQMDFQARDVATRIDFGSAQPVDGTNLPVLRNIRIAQTSNVAQP